MDGALFFGDLNSDAPPFYKAMGREAHLRIIFVIGPEGGFNDEEVRFITEKGGKGVKLHENILKTDTASLAALTLIHHHQMLFRS